jgi:hypothetical protein
LQGLENFVSNQEPQISMVLAACGTSDFGGAYLN